MSKLVSFFLDRPLVVNLIAIAIIGLGIKNGFEAQKEGFPEISLNKIIISTIHPGASPRDVELNITVPIEDALAEVEGIQEVVSTSEEGISTITIQVDENASENEFEDIYNEVDTILAKVDDLPMDIDGKPSISKFTSKDIPILEISFFGPYEKLKSFVPFVKSKLKEIDDISAIDEVGLPDDEVQITVDPIKAKKYMVDLRTIASAIQKRNLEGSGGTLESFVDEKKIVFFSKFNNYEDVLETNIVMSPDGFGVKLKQVATVKIVPKDIKLLVRNNGKRGVILNIKKKGKSDIIKTSKKIKKILNNIKLPEGVSWKLLLDQSAFTESRLNILTGNSMIGFVLVAIILFVIFNFKTALWTAFGIPFSLLGVMIFLKSNNYSLNLISLGAFVIVLGMIVDDAIVIAEEINTNKEKGMEPREAAIEAVKKMWLPVLGASLTTMVAFSPIFSIGGFPGKFVWVIPLMIIATLIISLFESYFILPAHLYHGKYQKEEKKKIVILLENVYRSFLIKAIKLRYAVLVFFVIVLFLSIASLNLFVKKDPFPQDSSEGFNIQITLPKGSSQALTVEETKKFEAELLALPESELVGISSRIGTQNEVTSTNRGIQNNIAIIHVYLTKFADRKRTAEEIIDSIRKKIDSKIDTKKIVYSINLKRIGPPLGKPFEIRISSNDKNLRYAKEKKIRDFLSKINGVTDVENDDIEGKDEWNIILNHDILARTGLNVEDVLTTLRIAFDGMIVTDMTTINEKLDFRLRLNKKGRADKNFIRNLTIMNKNRNLIKLGEFVKYQEQPSVGGIHHVNGKRTITIYGNADLELITPVEVMQKVKEKFTSDEKVRISYAGQPVETQKIFKDLSSAAITALIGVYLIICLTFNSMTKPFIILLTIPFGIIGIAFTMITHGLPMSMFIGISMVGLIGVMVNDSIVMVHTISHIGEKEKLSHHNIIDGAVSRLRPILLTTITTFLGVIPTGYGIGGYDPFLSHMCLGMGYGLLFATLSILFMVPIYYSIGLDVKKEIIKFKNSNSPETWPG